MDFPALAWSAELHEDHFMLLDERQLPDRKEYIRIDDHIAAASAIREMKTRAFGQLLTVLYAMILTARRSDDLIKELEDAAVVLEKSRPTFGFKKYTRQVVSWAMDAVKEEHDDPTESVVSRITGFLDQIREMRLRRARIAADLIQDGDVILTHCNTSGELVLAARECRNQKKTLRFYATETRPYFQGRLTAWEMSSDGFDVTLVPDNRAAAIIGDGLCTKVITGSDRVARNGDIVNKTGTSQLALCAHEAGIPFYAFVQGQDDVRTGSDVPIEHRDKNEVSVYKGHEVYSDGLEVFYPAFDVTPACLIDMLITFDNAVTPAEFDGSDVGKKTERSA